MPANKFDDLLRQRFEEEVPEYNPAAWTMLAARLTQKKSRSNRGLIALWPALSIGLAASITAAACMLFPAQYNSRHKADTTEIITAALPPQPAAGAASALISPTRQIPVAANLNAHNKVAEDQFAVMAASSVPAMQQPRDTSVMTAIITTSETIAPNKTAAAAAAVTGINAYAPYDEPAPATHNRIVLSLAGGMQYGTLNAGYAAAINLRRNVSRRWYIDADMGYITYNASGAQQMTYIPATSVSKPAVAGKASGSGNNNASTGVTVVPPPPVPVVAEVKQIAQVQYIQASPGVGYRVSSHFTIGASVDFQRALLSNSGDNPPVEDAGGKVLPLMDIGAAARVQISISKGLKAGLIYRGGLNSILNSGGNYLDRHYLQAQLVVPLTGGR